MDRVVIVGGGIVGISIAYHLAAGGHRDVVVLERGRIGEATTAKATGGIRQQFSSTVNIELARAAVEYFVRFEALVGEPIVFRQHGYLFVTADPSTMDLLARSAALQADHSVPVHVLDPSDIAALAPGIHVDDLLGGTFCATDGSASPTDVCAAFARQARRLGVRILQDSPVDAIAAADQHLDVFTPENVFAADVAINAAGPWAAAVGAMVGVDHPIEPHPRQVFAIRRPGWLDIDMPLTVDLDSGAYVHAEPGAVVVGGTDRDRPVAHEAIIDDSLLERLIAALVHRFHGLDDAEVMRGWVGLREMTPDDHALVGPVPEVPGYWVAAGFSGHGFMHAPVIGREVANWLLEGAPSIDLASLSPGRFDAARPEDESYVF
jgi:sarcosine oxidase subunit beta